MKCFDDTATAEFNNAAAQLRRRRYILLVALLSAFSAAVAGLVAWVFMGRPTWGALILGVALTLLPVLWAWLRRLDRDQIQVEVITHQYRLAFQICETPGQFSLVFQALLRELDANHAPAVAPPRAPSEPATASKDDDAEFSAELSGEIVSVNPQEAICWLEVVPGVRVKTRLPTAQLAPVGLQPGTPFSWSAATNTAKVRGVPKVHAAASHEELLAESDRLRRELHDLRLAPLRTDDAE